MIDKLKQHEKAWTEFVEWMKESGYDYIVDIENFAWDYKGDAIVVGHPELYGLAIEWLDSKGIIITSRWYFDNSESYKGTYEYELWEFPEDHCCRFTSNGYDNRNQGKEETIIRAFEIYNQKEK